MSESDSSGERPAQTLHVEGEQSLVVPWSDLSRRWQGALSRQTIGFECASGDWIEQHWTGIPATQLVDEVGFPAETTHVRLEAIDGVRACVPHSALEEAVIALDSGGDIEAPASIAVEDPYPRFVSLAVTGPRAIKRLSRIEPLSLDPGTDRNEYESLPKRD